MTKQRHASVGAGEPVPAHRGPRLSDAPGELAAARRLAWCWRDALVHRSVSGTFTPLVLSEADDLSHPETAAIPPKHGAGSRAGLPASAEAPGTSSPKR
jgi:hypothetical protein